MNIFEKYTAPTTPETHADSGTQDQWNPSLVSEIIAQLDKVVPLVEWPQFSGGGVDVLQHWSEEMRAAINKEQPAGSDTGLAGIWQRFVASKPASAGETALDLAGDRLLIQCEDTEKALLAVRRAARDIGLDFLSLNDTMLEQAPNDFLAMLKAIYAHERPLLVHVPTFGLFQYHIGMARAAYAQKQQITESGLPGELTGSALSEEQRQAQLAKLIAAKAPALHEVSRLEALAEIMVQFVSQNRTRPEGVPLIIVLTTPTSDGGNVLIPLDDDLRAKDVINREFHVPRRSLETIGKEFIERLGPEYCDDTLIRSAAKVGRVVLEERWQSESTNKRFRRHLLRMARQAGRKILFEDLINITLRGTMEADELPMKNRIRESTAYHEAGHALATIIGSGGRDIPEYATAVPGTTMSGLSYLGVVRSAVDGSDDKFKDMTYHDLCIDIRHTLAGRATEELIYGSANVSTGASNDLEQATLKSMHFFAGAGFAPGMHDAKASGSNLAIYPGLAGTNLAAYFGAEHAAVFNSTAQVDRIYELVRQFLAQEYQATLEMLKANRRFLDMIVDAMIGAPLRDDAGQISTDDEGATLRGRGDPVLDRSELEALYRAYLSGAGR